jgi:cysteinyl-tRNA synthetase
MDVDATTMSDANESLGRLDALARRFELDPALADVREDEAPARGVDAAALEAFVERMDDDLDTPGAVAGIFDLVRRANSAADGGDMVTGRTLAVSVAVLAGAMGLKLAGPGEAADEQTAELVRQRDQARAQRDWATADELRAALESRGWVVEDTAGGTRLHRRDS